jgi:hypothetical protein
MARGPRRLQRISSSFRKAKAKAGLDGVNFADLRGTAVTRLVLAGCPVPEICAATRTTRPTASCRSTTQPRSAACLERHPKTRVVCGQFLLRHSTLS